ncbi:hypothetical protein HMPREF0326_03161 [Desulfovibrio sp. 3_1_syn3]|uniref:MobV family relaxase n=1 Tax=Desulfovibrio sp. 3_1_syn3 TaxID=457398 RepID=UPI0002F49446|nr:MobV family relaxase [Desulfovibrio sp. 3_1_syn3]EFL84307.2 hypothetical protein HMPREF0326_03161 [Desulfovibrio sp. 3_1_syn3]
MSYIVLHMDKFKKEAVRGIQSHNRRERESHSNPDIDYERSGHNYDLHEPIAGNYVEVIQNRIDDLLLVKAVRKDAVHMCGLIISSDSAFFEKLPPEETKRFFEESKAFLADFVGSENVISATVHMDEKTPHMHFLHVPVTSDGRLNANKIYTRESLKKLQTELPAYLQSRGFNVQRGVEQMPGATKKHLDTREFKQQQEALNSLQREAQAVNAELEQRQQEEFAMQERLQSYEQQAQEAEKALSEQTEIPKASMLNYKVALEADQAIIERQKKVIAAKGIVTAKSEKQEAEIQGLSNAVFTLKEQVARLEREKNEQQQRSDKTLMRWMKDHSNLSARLEEIEKFFRWNPEANKMHLDYLQEQRQEAQRKATEQNRLAQEREQQERREAELTKEKEAQQLERERERVQCMEQRPRGMGMGR